jgi:hypothetical protein
VLRRTLTLAAVAGLACVLMTAPALAAPPASNPQQDQFEVTCGAETFDVITTKNSSGVAVFGPDGRVLVAKNFAGEIDGELMLDGTDEEGPVSIPVTDEFEERPKGIDPARLVTCTFEDSFSAPVVVDQELLDELGIEDGEDLIGRAGTFTGTFTGIVGVLMPGKR